MNHDDRVEYTKALARAGSISFEAASDIADEAIRRYDLTLGEAMRVEVLIARLLQSGAGA